MLKRYAAGLALGTLPLLALLVLTALVDPAGALAGRWAAKPQLCTPGIRVTPWLALPSQIANLRPREVLLGSSRIRWALARPDAEVLLSLPVLNLGIDGGSVRESELLFSLAARTGALERAWLAVDFGAFVLDVPSRKPPLERASVRDLVSSFHSFAIRAAVGAALDRSRCATPETDLRGFPYEPAHLERIRRAGWPTALATARASARAEFEAVARRAGARTMEHSRAQWSALDAIADGAARSGVRLVLMTNPVHRDYQRAIDAAGLADERIAWRARLVEWAKIRGVPFFDWSDLPATFEADIDACDPTADPACPLLDISHPRPVIGRAIFASMVAELGRRPGPSS